MTSHVRSAPPIGAPEYAAIEDRLSALLGTDNDVLLLQGEAILAIEAAARGLGGPETRALNIVTSPYGASLGRWLAVGGCAVENLDVGLERAATLAEVEAALDRGSFDVVSVVHAEGATGALNPLAEIAGVAREHGALVIADAVASIGAEAVEIDAWGIDLTVIGPHKALGGPSGVCAVAISERGWAALEQNPAAPRDSLLSLLDWRERWLRPGRRELPLIAHHLETRALAATLERSAVEGLDHTVERHRRSRDAARAGVRRLGLRPWIDDDASAAAVATLLAVPESIASGELLALAMRASPGAPLGLAPGELARRALRINHTGDAARLEAVLAALAGLSLALSEATAEPVDASALDTALAAWNATGTATAASQ
jgi:aspartate aminotransferase-like enzyme